MKKADDYVICFLFCPKKVRGTGTAGNNKNRDDFSSLFSFYKVCSNQLPKFFARISIKTRLREGFANAQAFAGVAETGGICKCASVCRRRRDGRGDPSPTLQHSFMQLSKNLHIIPDNRSFFCPIFFSKHNKTKTEMKNHLCLLFIKSAYHPR